MTPFPSPIPPEFQVLIDEKKFDALEALWTQRMEATPGDLDLFFAVAAAVKKKGSGASALAWLRFLADCHEGDEKIRVLLEIARMSPTDAAIRKALADALRARFAGHPVLSAVLAQFPVESASDPSEVAGKISRWLRFLPGDIYLMPVRGAGRLVDMNPALDVMRLEVAGVRVPLSLVSAEKNLTRLPEEHFLRRRVEDPQAVADLAEKDAPETVRWLLASFGRSMTVAEIKEHVSRVVGEERWSSFWTAARKHPQILVSGSAKSAVVAWTDSAGAAEGSVRESFEKAKPAAKMDLARKHAKRSKELARFMGQSLAHEAKRAGAAHPAMAWELSQAAAKLMPGEPEAFSAAELLAAGDLRKTLPNIKDHLARERAFEAIRESRADWAEIFMEQIAREEDGRALTMLFGALGDRATDLTRKILRSPRSAPRAFVWICERMHAEGKSEPASLFLTLSDALRMDEFSGLRSRMKEFFEPGGFAVSLVRSAASEEEARSFLHGMDRVFGLEEHRRATVREALLMKFPELRAPARDYLYATAESIESKRQELIRLRQVDLPANSEAMKAAKEHGDLSENFEYHAARQKHEYLSARIASLADELSRTRTLDSSKIDVSEVRVGTRVRMRDATGTERDFTILGPWDSKPEDAIYSYESEFAQRLLGSRPGDRVNLPEGQVEVLSIQPWR
ncbi:MAG: GreA/GreB family elongation factor [Acidobacteriota bacterium]